jgi:hypothetical protein
VHVLIPFPGSSEFELLAVSTARFANRDRGFVFKLPVAAIDAVGRRDAFVYVVEGLTTDAPGGIVNPPPTQYRDRPTRFETAPVRVVECVGPGGGAYAHRTFRYLYFNDHNRVIGVYIVWGTDVSQTRRAQTWRLVDSLRFEQLPPGPRPRNYRDDLNGVSVSIPGDWIQQTIDRRNLLDLATPERVGDLCGASTNSTFLSVHELMPPNGSVALPPAQPRPSLFGPSSGTTRLDTGSVTVNGCQAQLSQTTQNIVFADGGRDFQVMLRFYPQATLERRQQAYDILNSMKITRVDRLHRGRPPNKIRVFVLNGSGHAGALAPARDTLTNFGYVFAGSRQVTIHATTEVTCKTQFNYDREPLARAIDPTAVITAYPRPALDRINHADCIITLSQRAPFTITPGQGSPQQVRVKVLNGSNDSAAAARVSNQLRGLGYTIEPPTTTAARTGSVVQCRANLTQDARSLIQALGPTFKMEPLPNPPPPAATGIDCLIILGN